MKALIAILLIAASMSTSAETYVHVNGLSIHDQPGFNGFNYGAGMEQSVATNWTVAGGYYRNSDYRGSVYAYARYAVYKQGPWDIGVGVGAVTGYIAAPVTPSLFPQVCYTWVCALFVPKVNSIGANALAFQLRIPISQ